jgi:hypothetical protein
LIPENCNEIVMYGNRNRHSESRLRSLIYGGCSIFGILLGCNDFRFFGISKAIKANDGVSKIFRDACGVEPQNISARMSEQLVDQRIGYSGCRQSSCEGMAALINGESRKPRRLQSSVPGSFHTGDVGIRVSGIKNTYSEIPFVALRHFKSSDLRNCVIGRVRSPAAWVKIRHRRRLEAIGSILCGLMGPSRRSSLLKLACLTKNWTGYLSRKADSTEERVMFTSTSNVRTSR